MGFSNIKKTPILILFLAVGFFVGISFSSVYAGIPWGTSEIADNAITSEKIKQRQVKSGDMKNNAVKSNKIRDGTIQGADIDPSTSITVASITSQTTDDFEQRISALEGTFANPQSNCSGTAACIPGYVTANIDGDTLKVYGKSIRFALVDAPESGEMGFQDASDFIANACPVDALAVVDEDDMQTGGSFGRIIGVVHCNGMNLNEAILDSGLAVLAVSFCGSSEFGSSTWAQNHGCP